jgi:hypothetical protein
MLLSEVSIVVDIAGRECAVSLATVIAPGYVDTGWWDVSLRVNIPQLDSLIEDQSS